MMSRTIYDMGVAAQHRFREELHTLLLQGIDAFCAFMTEYVGEKNARVIRSDTGGSYGLGYDGLHSKAANDHYIRFTARIEDAEGSQTWQTFSVREHIDEWLGTIIYIQRETPLVEWKDDEGFRAHVRIRNGEIGSWSNSEDIQNYWSEYNIRIQTTAK